MSIRRFLLLSCCLLFFSCKNVTTIYVNNIDFTISSPKANWKYYEDAKIMLAVDVKAKNIAWSSDITGNLGNGNHLTLRRITL